MRFIQFLILFLFLNFQASAQQAYIGNENGQWVILSNLKKVSLPLTYHSVSNFDLAGFASFGDHEYFGVIDSRGNVSSDPRYHTYLSIEQLGGGFYSCVSKSSRYLVEFEMESSLTINYEELERLEDTWIVLNKSTAPVLINTTSRKRIVIDSTMQIADHLFGYMKVRTGNNVQVFDKNGDELSLEEGDVYFNEDHVQLKLKDQNKIIYSDHVIDLPLNLTNLEVGKEEIQYSTMGATTIIDPMDGRVIMSISCDDLRHITSSVYTFKKGWKTGLVGIDGMIICPAMYISIWKRGEYYYVTGKNGVGVMTAGGEMIVPSKFSDVRRRGGFFEVTTTLGMKGIYSSITKKPILAENYLRIAISSDKLRAWISDNLVLIEFDSVHKITSRLTLKNTISKYKPVYDKKTKSVDQRLYSVGWFDESKPKFNKEGFQTGDIIRWGIRDNNDSLLCKAKYSTPNFIPLAGFGTVFRNKLKYSHLGGKVKKSHVFSVIDLSTGAPMMPEGVLDVDTMDLFTRNYTRFVSPKGFGYITNDNKVKYVMHMDGGDTEFVRYCTSKTKERVGAGDTDAQGVSMRSARINDNPTHYSSYVDRLETYDKVTFPGSKWNFLDTNGINIFDQDFEFAEPFHRKTAIYKDGGRWGVLNADTTIIPTIYSQIIRLTEVTDTIFKVKLVPQGLRFLDSLSKDLALPITRILKSKTNYAVVNVGAKRMVINDKYEILSDDGKSYKVLDDESYYSKMKKNYTMNTSFGEPVGTVKVKPTGLLFDSFILALVKGKYGVVSSSGDTLISFKYKKIEQHGKFVYAFNGFNNLVYNDKLELVRDAKALNVLFDVSNNQFAILNGDKVKVYDEANDQQAKFSDIRPTLFLNGMLIQEGSKGFSINVNEEESELPARIFEVSQLEDYGYLVWMGEDTCYYYSPDWKKYAGFEATKRVRYLGESFVTTRTSTGTMVFSPTVSKVLGPTENVEGKFVGGFLLLRQGKKYFYLNSQLEHAFGRTYRKASSYVNGYATVKEINGWTIIDSRGYPKSVSNFDEITPRGQNIFETKKQSRYGLFDSHGTEIIPVEYEQINVLYGTVIQGIKKNEIFYFDLKGNPIDLNRK